MKRLGPGEEARDVLPAGEEPRFGTRLYPMWRVRLCGPRGYRHECGAAVELEWDYHGPGGLLSVRWGGGYLERRIELPPRKQTWKTDPLEDWNRSHRKAKLIYLVTEEMLLELAPGHRRGGR